MTDFLVNNPNITILYFFVSIFIMGASAISIFFMYKTIKHKKTRFYRHFYQTICKQDHKD